MMQSVKQIFILIIGIFIFGSSLNGRVVEVWPGYNYYKKFKNNENAPIYVKNFNFVVKDGYAYPIDSLLTRNHFKYRPYFASAALLNSKTFMMAIEDISETRDSLQNVVDPISFLRSFFPKQLDTGEVVTNTMIEDAINNFFMSVAAIIVKKSEGVSAKTALTTAVIEYVLKEEFLKSHINIPSAFINNEGIKYLISKSTSIAIDYLWEAGLTKAAPKIIAKELFSGFMGAVTFYMEVINGSINIISTVWAINSIDETTRQEEIKLYINEFLRDYTNKYNMDIYRMASDSNLTIYGKEYIPHNFFQLFVLYTAKNRNLSYNDLMSLNGKFMYYMWLGAHTALSFIEKYGDGGNLKIYLDVDDTTGNIKILPKSYALNSLYWMLPLELETDVNMNMMNQNTLEGKLYLANNNFSGYNPFKKVTNDMLFNALLMSDEHISINGTGNLKSVNIQSKFENEAFQLNLSKVINYNGFIEPSFRIYKKILINYPDIFIPKYYWGNLHNNENDILLRYLQLGIIEPSVNIGERLFSAIDAMDIKLYFYRFRKIYGTSVKYGGVELDKAFNSIQWTTPVKRKQFFKFLVKLLKIDTLPHYSTGFTKAYFNIFSKKAICQNTTLEGCALKGKGISNGTNPENPVTLFQVLLTLDRIESLYVGSPK